MRRPPRTKLVACLRKLRLDAHQSPCRFTGLCQGMDLAAALVQRHGIAAERLMTGGYGKSVPKEPNDTAEGRARNRRVELTRL